MSASLGPDSDAGTTVDPTPSLPAFAVGLLVGAVILGLVWAGSALMGGEADAGSTTPPPTRASSLLSEPAAAPVVTRTRHDRCVDAVARLRAPLDAAGPAMDQWRVHVGAMNKLVVGEITPQQAADFWDRTRVGAQRRLAAFDEAGDEAERRGIDCPTPQRLGRASTEVRDCAARVAADEATWLAARRALATWAEHVEDMDMLKMGHLSLQDAGAKWLASWQQGVREIDAYRGAAKVSRAAPAC